MNAYLQVEVYFEQMSMEDWAQEVTVIPGLGAELVQMWNYCQKIGFFGGERGGTKIITEVSQLLAKLCSTLTVLLTRARRTAIKDAKL